MRTKKGKNCPFRKLVIHRVARESKITCSSYEYSVPAILNVYLVFEDQMANVSCAVVVKWPTNPINSRNATSMARAGNKLLSKLAQVRTLK